MDLYIDGQFRLLTPIQAFRAAYRLPPAFGLAGYESKHFEGLATIDRAGSGLAHLRATLPTTIPERVLIFHLLPVVEELQAMFDRHLLALNDCIGLKPQEIDFAVAGFGDVLRRWAYALVAESAGGEPAVFATVYNHWLADSVRLSGEIHEYLYGDETWSIQTIHYVYGRVGLRVRMPAEMVYVADTTYTCPAAGYMVHLLTDIAESLARAVR